MSRSFTGDISPIGRRGYSAVSIAGPDTETSDLFVRPPDDSTMDEGSMVSDRVGSGFDLPVASFTPNANRPSSNPYSTAHNGNQALSTVNPFRGSIGMSNPYTTAQLRSPSGSVITTAMSGTASPTFPAVVRDISARHELQTRGGPTPGTRSASAILGSLLDKQQAAGGSPSGAPALPPGYIGSRLSRFGSAVSETSSTGAANGTGAAAAVVAAARASGGSTLTLHGGTRDAHAHYSHAAPTTTHTLHAHAAPTTSRFPSSGVHRVAEAVPSRSSGITYGTAMSDRAALSGISGGSGSGSGLVRDRSMGPASPTRQPIDTSSADAAAAPVVLRTSVKTAATDGTVCATNTPLRSSSVLNASPRGRDVALGEAVGETARAIRVSRGSAVADARCDTTVARMAAVRSASAHGGLYCGSIRSTETTTTAGAGAGAVAVVTRRAADGCIVRTVVPASDSPTCGLGGGGSSAAAHLRVRSASAGVTSAALYTDGVAPSASRYTPGVVRSTPRYTHGDTARYTHTHTLGADGGLVAGSGRAAGDPTGDSTPVDRSPPRRLVISHATAPTPSSQWSATRPSRSPVRESPQPRESTPRGTAESFDVHVVEVPIVPIVEPEVDYRSNHPHVEPLHHHHSVHTHTHTHTHDGHAVGSATATRRSQSPSAGTYTHFLSTDNHDHHLDDRHNAVVVRTPSHVVHTTHTATPRSHHSHSHVHTHAPSHSHSHVTVIPPISRLATRAAYVTSTADTTTPAGGAGAGAGAGRVAVRRSVSAPGSATTATSHTASPSSSFAASPRALKAIHRRHRSSSRSARRRNASSSSSSSSSSSGAPAVQASRLEYPSAPSPRQPAHAAPSSTTVVPPAVCGDVVYTVRLSEGGKYITEPKAAAPSAAAAAPSSGGIDASWRTGLVPIAGAADDLVVRGAGDGGDRVATRTTYIGHTVSHAHSDHHHHHHLRNHDHTHTHHHHHEAPHTYAQPDHVVRLAAQPSTDGAPLPSLPAVTPAILHHHTAAALSSFPLSSLTEAVPGRDAAAPATIPSKQAAAVSSTIPTTFPTTTTTTTTAAKDTDDDAAGPDPVPPPAHVARWPPSLPSSTGTGAGDRRRDRDRDHPDHHHHHHHHAHHHRHATSSRDYDGSTPYSPTSTAPRASSADGSRGSATAIASVLDAQSPSAAGRGAVLPRHSHGRRSSVDSDTAMMGTTGASAAGMTATGTGAPAGGTRGSARRARRASRSRSRSRSSSSSSSTRLTATLPPTFGNYSAPQPTPPAVPALRGGGQRSDAPPRTYYNTGSGAGADPSAARFDSARRDSHQSVERPTASLPPFTTTGSAARSRSAGAAIGSGVYRADPAFVRGSLVDLGPTGRTVSRDTLDDLLAQARMRTARLRGEASAADERARVAAAAAADAAATPPLAVVDLEEDRLVLSATSGSPIGFGVYHQHHPDHHHHHHHHLGAHAQHIPNRSGSTGSAHGAPPVAVHHEHRHRSVVIPVSRVGDVVRSTHPPATAAAAAHDAAVSGAVGVGFTPIALGSALPPSTTTTAAAPRSTYGPPPGVPHPGPAPVPLPGHIPIPPSAALSHPRPTDPVPSPPARVPPTAGPLVAGLPAALGGFGGGHGPSASAAHLHASYGGPQHGPGRPTNPLAQTAPAGALPIYPSFPSSFPPTTTDGSLYTVGSQPPTVGAAAPPRGRGGVSGASRPRSGLRPRSSTTTAVQTVAPPPGSSPFATAAAAVGLVQTPSPNRLRPGASSAASGGGGGEGSLLKYQLGPDRFASSWVNDGVIDVATGPDPCGVVVASGGMAGATAASNGASTGAGGAYTGAGSSRSGGREGLRVGGGGSSAPAGYMPWMEVQAGACPVDTCIGPAEGTEYVGTPAIAAAEAGDAHYLPPPHHHHHHHHQHASDSPRAVPRTALVSQLSHAAGIAPPHDPTHGVLVDALPSAAVSGPPAGRGPPRAGRAAYVDLYDGDGVEGVPPPPPPPPADVHHHHHGDHMHVHGGPAPPPPQHAAAPAAQLRASPQPPSQHQLQQQQLLRQQQQRQQQRQQQPKKRSNTTGGFLDRILGRSSRPTTAARDGGRGTAAVARGGSGGRAAPAAGIHGGSPPLQPPPQQQHMQPPQQQPWQPQLPHQQPHRQSVPLHQPHQQQHHHHAAQPVAGGAYAGGPAVAGPWVERGTHPPPSGAPLPQQHQQQQQHQLPSGPGFRMMPAAAAPQEQLAMPQQRPLGRAASGPGGVEDLPPGGYIVADWAPSPDALSAFGSGASRVASPELPPPQSWPVAAMGDGAGPAGGHVDGGWTAGPPHHHHQQQQQQQYQQQLPPPQAPPGTQWAAPAATPVDLAPPPNRTMNPYAAGHPPHQSPAVPHPGALARPGHAGGTNPYGPPVAPAQRGAPPAGPSSASPWVQTGSGAGVAAAAAPPQGPTRGAPPPPNSFAISGNHRGGFVPHASAAGGPPPPPPLNVGSPPGAAGAAPMQRSRSAAIPSLQVGPRPRTASAHPGMQQQQQPQQAHHHHQRPAQGQPLGAGQLMQLPQAGPYANGRGQGRSSAQATQVNHQRPPGTFSYAEVRVPV